MGPLPGMKLGTVTIHGDRCPSFFLFLCVEVVGGVGNGDFNDREGEKNTSKDSIYALPKGPDKTQS